MATGSVAMPSKLPGPSFGTAAHAAPKTPAIGSIASAVGEAMASADDELAAGVADCRGAARAGAAGREGERQDEQGGGSGDAS